MSQQGIDTKIRAKGVCGYCGKELFRIRVLVCGCPTAVCDYCEEVWTPPDRERGADASGDEAVGGVRHERAHVVSKTKGG